MSHEPTITGPRLVISRESGPLTVPLQGTSTLTLGRSIACAIVIDDPSVSRLHARLERLGKSWKLFDEESANGTWLGDQRIESIVLIDGMELRLGAVAVRVDAVSERPTPLLPELTGADPLDERFGEVARLMRRLGTPESESAFLVELVDAAVRLSGAERGFVITKTMAGMEFRAARNVAEEDRRGPEFEVSWSIALRTGMTGESVLLVDAASDQRFSSSKSVENLRLRSVACVPVRAPGGVLGVLYVDHRGGAGRFSSDDLVVLEVLAHQAGIALERERARRAAERANPQLVAESLPAPALVGQSEAMENLRAVIIKVAASEHPVLITGESGSGKELVARAVHAQSRRAKGPWIPINVAAIPETLIESELFGHVRGAFTGADRAHTGLLEAANGGTLFLDEVEAMSPSLQARLLRALESGEVRPVGAPRPRKVDVRVVAATNRQLTEEVAHGRFREDLWYRLRVLTIEVPPLRERRDDIPGLVRHFLVKWGKPDMQVDPDALSRLASAAWKGNVRELENEIRRITAVSEGTIQLTDLSDSLREVRRGAESPCNDLTALVAAIEIREIRRALEEAAGNKSRAATLLGITRFALQRKMEKHGLSEATELDT